MPAPASTAPFMPLPSPCPRRAACRVTACMRDETPSSVRRKRPAWASAWDRDCPARRALRSMFSRLRAAPSACCLTLRGPLLRARAAVASPASRAARPMPSTASPALAACLATPPMPPSAVREAARTASMAFLAGRERSSRRESCTCTSRSAMLLFPLPPVLALADTSTPPGGLCFWGIEYLQKCLSLRQGQAPRLREGEALPDQRGLG